MNPRSVQGSSARVRVRLLFALLGPAALFWTQASRAATYLFTGTGTTVTQNWNLGSKWDTQPIDDSTFPNAAGAVADLNENMETQKVVFLNVSITLGELYIGDSGGAPRFPVAIRPGTNGSLIFDAPTGEAVLRKGNTNAEDSIDVTVLLRTNLVVDANTNQVGAPIRITGLIAGAGALRVASVDGNADAPALTLTGPNLYSGGTTLTNGSTGGALRLGRDAVGSAGGIVSSPLGTGPLVFRGGRLTSDGDTPRAILNDVAFHAGDSVSARLGAAADHTGTLTFRGPLTITGNRSLQVDSPVVFEGAVAESGGSQYFKKLGAAPLTLAGDNTFTGGIQIDQGELLVGHAGAFNRSTPNLITFVSNANGKTVTLNGVSVVVAGLVTGAIVGDARVRNGAATEADLTVAVADGVSHAFAGLIEDGGGGALGLTKKGGGTLTLTGANDFTGETRVSNGVLVVSSAHAGGGAFTVTGGAALGVTLNALGDTLAMSALTLGRLASDQTTSRLDVAAFGGPENPLIHASNLVVRGTNHVSLSGLGFSAGQFPLIRYGSATGLTDVSFVLEPLPAGMEGYVSNNVAGRSIDLVVAAAPVLVWNGATNGVAVNVWDINTTLNWLNPLAGVPAGFAGGETVRFDDTRAGAGSVNLTTNVRPGLVLVTNASADYAFNGAGRITGTCRLVKSGPGRLTVGTANTYGGGTVIQEGTFALGADDVIPSGTGKGDAIVDGTLDLAGFNEGLNGLYGGGVIDNTAAGASNTLTVGSNGASGAFSGVLQNTGDLLALDKRGAGVLALSGANTYGGGTKLAAGVLQLGRDHALGTGRLTLSGGTLSSDGAAPRILTNDLTVTAAVVLGDAANDGRLTLGGISDFNGGGRAVTCNGDAALTGPSGNGWLDKRGAAALTLGGLCVWSGDVDIFDGALVLDGALVTNSGAFRPNGDAPGGVARLALTNGAALVLTNTGANLRAGYTTGDGTQTNVIDIGGTVRIPNASASSGRAVLGAGSAKGILNLWPGGDLEVRWVQAGDQAIKGESELNFRGGVLRPKGNEDNFIRNLTAAFVCDGGAVFDTQGCDLAVAQPLLRGGSGGLEKRGPGALTLGGDNTYTGGTLVLDGTLALGADERLDDAGALVVNGTGAVFDAGGFRETVGAVALGDGTIRNGTVTGAAYTVSNGLVSATLAGSAALTKDGPGAVTLAAANTYTGATTVRAGRLAVSSVQAGGGAFAVQDGATLAVAVAAPGASLRTSGLTLGDAEGAGLEFDLGTFGNPAAPAIEAAGLTARGNVMIAVSGHGFAPGRFALIRHPGTIGGDGFSAFTLGALPVGVDAALSHAPEAVELVISRVTPVVWTGGANGDWDLATTNWQFGGAPTVYHHGDDVLFRDGAATAAVRLAADVAPGSVTVSNELAAYVFSGPGRITGDTELRKAGGGALYLSGKHLYTGATRVRGGTLAGDATLAGAVAVDAGGTLSPGLGIGALTIRNSLALSAGSTLLLEINRTNAPLNSDRIAGVTALHSGGTLTVVNTGGPLAAGDAFLLLQAAERAGAFAVTNLPPLVEGLVWDTRYFGLNGMIRVASTSPTGALARHVIQLSIDAMHADAPRALVDAGLGPNFARLFAEGAFTEEARTDYRSTVTSPNHTTEYTGRPIYDSTNAIGDFLPGHLWGENVGNPWNAYTNTSFHEIHAFTPAKTAYAYVHCVMDVAHDAGKRTGHFANKDRLLMEANSWDAVHGRLWPSVGPNDPGVSKIDFAFYENSHNDTVYDHHPIAAVLMSNLTVQMSRDPFDYTFLHLDPPDHWGHHAKWDLTTSPMSDYMRSIQEVDGYLGQLFDIVTTNPALLGTTAIILTADHGGVLGTTGHSVVDNPHDYRVDFFVWGPGVVPGADLYALNPQYAKPASTSRPDYAASGQPIRNGDAPNLGLHLLGLGPIPDSSLNFRQTLGAVDSDGDGLSDEYEGLAGLDPARTDTDRDGASDADEIRAGTDPKDGGSVFELTGARPTPALDRMIVTWSSVANRRYSLWSCRELPGVFSLLEPDLPATPPLNVYTDAVDELPLKFYDVRIQP